MTSIAQNERGVGFEVVGSAGDAPSGLRLYLGRQRSGAGMFSSKPSNGSGANGYTVTVGMRAWRTMSPSASAPLPVGKTRQRATQKPQRLLLQLDYPAMAQVEHAAYRRWAQ